MQIQAGILNSFRALPSKIECFCSLLSQSNDSMVGRMSSKVRPVSGLTDEPTPGHSAPNRQRSAPTVSISRRSAPYE